MDEQLCLAGNTHCPNCGSKLETREANGFTIYRQHGHMGADCIEALGKRIKALEEKHDESGLTQRGA